MKPLAVRGALIGLIALACPTMLRAQERPIDRWLVTGGPVSSADSEALPLDGPLFPERDRTVGPGYWSLLRDDGRARFDLSEGAGTGGRALAHTYIRAPTDLTLGLRLAAEPCATLSAWLNGSSFPPSAETADIRLAAGWNTLLVVWEGGAGCPMTLAAALRAPSGLRNRQAPPLDLARLAVQASKPPGARPNRPAGVIGVGTPRVEGFRWRPEGDLVGKLDLALVSWGRADGGTGDAGRRARPTVPPSVDLTGAWDLTLFSPTGIQRVRAELRMAGDGGLEGTLARGREGDERRGVPLEGVIREGWVSGERFGWKLRLAGRGRSGEIEFAGAVEDDELRGTIDFGGARDLESRFEGQRAGADGAETGTPAGGGPDPAAGPAGARDSLTDPLEAAGGEPPPAEAPRGGTDDELSPPPDPDGRRAAMVRRLLGTAAPRAPAPRRGSLELRVAGERLTREAELVPGVTRRLEAEIPFRRIRDAALREGGVEAKVRWDGGERDLEGRLSADQVLRAFHGPIELMGLAPGAGASAEFRVPEAFTGFSLRGLEGRWWAGSAEAPEGILCSPCRGGQRLSIGYEGSEPPRVRVVEPGYPEAADRAGAPAAAEWLRALEGNNRRYRELTGGGS